MYKIAFLISLCSITGFSYGGEDLEDFSYPGEGYTSYPIYVGYYGSYSHHNGYYATTQLQQIGHVILEINDEMTPWQVLQRMREIYKVNASLILHTSDTESKNIGGEKNMSIFILLKKYSRAELRFIAF